MQVTITKDSDSFVVIGGEKSSKFNVAATAAAFKIMSDTLYRDKTRATAREVLCNAIDAHIDAGIPDEPVVVTLTDDEMIVADQGLGIPHDKIGEIYCTLFGSTKAQNKRATGGFGLGCKAPFSISDHFTMTSCHKGTKSIYAMVASDPEEEGCPSAKRMMAAPTDQCGVTVSIPLAPGMRRKLEGDIVDVAKEGGMAVRLNGNLIDTPDFRKLREHGFGLMAKVPSKSGRKVAVLYANVLYPLDPHPELDVKIAELMAFAIPSRDWVLYAQPSTIGITPSRETLSYDDETVAILKGMLTRAVRETQAGAARAMRSVLDDQARKLKRHTLNEWGNHEHRPTLPFDNHCGGEAAGWAFAITRVQNGNVPQHELARAFLRRFKGHTKGLRLIAARTSISRRGLSLNAERCDYIMRTVTRVVGADALHCLYRRDRPGGKFASPRKPEAYRYSDRDYPFQLEIGPNQRAFGTSNGYFLTTGKLSDSQIAGIKARAKKLGMEIVEAPKPAPVERVKTPKPKEMFGPPAPPPLRGFSEVRSGSVRCYGNQHDLMVNRFWNGRRIFQPDAIYTAKATTVGGDDGFVLPRQDNKEALHRLVHDVVGKVSIVTKREELENPLLANVPRIERVVLDRLKQRVKRRKPYEWLYARMAMFAQDKLKAERVMENYSERQFARRLAAMGRDLAHAGIRERYTVNPDRDEAYSLWLLASLLFEGRHREVAHMDAAEAKMLSVLHAEYRALAQPLEAQRFGETQPWERVGHLSLLLNGFSHSDLTHLDANGRADFIHLAEELGRRHDARSKKEITK